MLERFLQWVLVTLLNWVVLRANKEVKSWVEEIKQNQVNEGINADNLAKYKAAKDRSERARAALALLNRSSSGV